MKKRVNIMITEKNLKYLDDCANDYEVSRSDMINMIIGDHVRSYEAYQEDEQKDYYMDLPLDTPYLKAVLGE